MLLSAVMPEASGVADGIRAAARNLERLDPDRHGARWSIAAGRCPAFHALGWTAPRHLVPRFAVNVNRSCP